jgi:hypothetical protein
MILDIEETDSPKRVGIQLRGFGTPEQNRLIASQSGSEIDRVRGSSDIIEVAFGPGHEERCVLRKAMETSEIDISTVHDIEGSGFEDQLIQEGDIVNLPMSDADYARDRASQIHLGMEFDSAFVLSKRGPRKEGETQIDRGGIQSVSGLGDLRFEVFARIQLSGHSDQHMGKVGVNAPIPFFVRIGQRAPGNLAPDPCVIKLGLHGPQTYFDIAKALLISQLSEGHTKKLIETGKGPNPVFALIPKDTFVEFVSWEKTHELRENDSS